MTPCTQVFACAINCPTSPTVCIACAHEFALPVFDAIISCTMAFHVLTVQPGPACDFCLAISDAQEVCDACCLRVCRLCKHKAAHLAGAALCQTKGHAPNPAPVPLPAGEKNGVTIDAGQTEYSKTTASTLPQGMTGTEARLSMHASFATSDAGSEFEHSLSANLLSASFKRADGAALCMACDGPLTGPSCSECRFPVCSTCQTQVAAFQMRMYARLARDPLMRQPYHAHCMASIGVSLPSTPCFLCTAPCGERPSVCIYGCPRAAVCSSCAWLSVMQMRDPALRRVYEAFDTPDLLYAAARKE